MTTTVRFDKFDAPNYSQGRYTRRGYYIMDANLRYGDVRPFACPELLCEDVGEKFSLHPLPECECLGFDEQIADVVQGFCHDQHFIVGNGELYQATTEELCEQQSLCLAGSPFQPDAPNVVSNCENCDPEDTPPAEGEPPNNYCDDNCDPKAYVYVLTYLTEHAGLQVESAPSPPSDVFAANTPTPEAVVSWGAPPDGYCIVATRLYRTESTFMDGESANAEVEGTEYVLVAEFVGTGTRLYVDNVPSCDTGFPLMTYLPMPFPAPSGLVGVCRTDDGLVVADEHRVYISESGLPMFTFDGVVEVEDTILAIRNVGNTIFVFTNHRPVKIGYRHTDGTMSIDRQVVERDLPLASIRSLSVWGSKVYFSSTYSLYEWDIGGYGADIRSLMDESLTPEQWRNIQPDTVRGAAYEYGYIFSADGIDHALMAEPRTVRIGNSSSTRYALMPITYAKANAYATKYDGVIVYEQDGDIYEWDWRRDPCADFVIQDNIRPNLCEQCECCPWTLSMYFDNEGKNRFTTMRVEFDERSYHGGIKATFYQHGFGNSREILWEATVINSRGFNLPKHVSSQTFYMELESCAIMHEVRVATSFEELTIDSNAVAR